VTLLRSRKAPAGGPDKNAVVGRVHRFEDRIAALIRLDGKIRTPSSEVAGRR
jgi:hypothetical protein